MKKVEIENIENGNKFAGVFELQSEADKWITDQIKNKSWGKTEGEYTITQIDISAEINFEKELKKVTSHQII